MPGPGHLDEQRRYYSARAAEFDDAYARVGQHDRGEAVNAEWRSEIEVATKAFDAVPLDGDVIELAAGTGYWTQRLARRARSLTVLDGSAEMLAINRQRLGTAAATVNYQFADLFEWWPRRTWDRCVFCFWLCHVPDDRLCRFLHSVRSALHAGGIVGFVDKAARAEPDQEHVVRTLNDGRAFTIVDHPRSPARLADAFARAGFDVTIQTAGSRFCIGWGRRR